MENKSFKNRWIEHFDALASTYSKYKNRFKYYRKDNIKYFNYFLLDTNSILEVGCGIGDTLNELKGDRKKGIDFSPNMIKQAKSNYPDIEFELADASNFKEEEKYDVIILSNVIGCFENVSDVLNNISNCCHQNTKVFINHYNRLWQPLINFAEFIRIKKKSPEQNWLSQHDIKNLLFLSGFDSFRDNTRLLIPFNIPLISFIFNKFFAKLPLLHHMCLSQYVFAKPFPGKEHKDYTVTVVVPARNESGNIERAILETPELGLGTELIFIEGNSTDDTWEVIQQMAEKYKDTRKIIIDRQPGKGKYDAVKKGYDIATGDILMILDGDLTVPPKDLTKFYDALATSKGEFINGSRLVYPMEKEAMRFLNIIGNKFFSYAFSWLLEQPIKDTLCGTKVMFRKDYIKLAENRKYFGDFDPFGDFDLLFGAYKLNLKIIDLPVRYKERVYGETNISRFKHGLILLRMVMFAMNKIKFY